MHATADSHRAGAMAYSHRRPQTLPSSGSRPTGAPFKEPSLPSNATFSAPSIFSRPRHGRSASHARRVLVFSCRHAVGSAPPRRARPRRP